MQNFKVSINNDVNEQIIELRSDETNVQWVVYYNGIKSSYSLKPYHDNHKMYYDLCKNDEPIKGFSFEDGGIGVSTNLLELLTYITKIS